MNMSGRGRGCERAGWRAGGHLLVAPELLPRALLRHIQYDELPLHSRGKKDGRRAAAFIVHFRFKPAAPMRRRAAKRIAWLAGPRQQ